MASLEHVIRVSRIDSKEKDSFVFIHTSGATSDPINIRLLATEGEQAYVTTITPSRIQAALDSKSPQSLAQWTDTVLSLLRQQHHFLSLPSDLETNELVAFLSPSPPTLNLLFRKNISGITQRLGAFSLPHDADEELDILRWTSLAIERATSLSRDVAALNTSITSAERTIASLNQQLEELLTAKQAHESALLGKCAELLNQKKVKIREQQRLLASTTSGHRRPEPSPPVLAGRTGNDRAPKGTRTAMAKGGLVRSEGPKKKKRKAADADLREGGDDDEEDEEDAFEGPSSLRPIKVKEEEDEHEEDKDEDMDDRAETPDLDDQEDEVTDDDDDDDANQVMPLGEDKEHQGGNEAHSTNMHRLLGTSDLPPDRTLPFDDKATAAASSRSATSVQPAAAQAGEDEEETDDDDDDDDEL